MKKILIFALLFGAAALSAPVMTDAQNVVPDKPIYVGGVGPAVAGSASEASIPKDGLRFLKENYPSESIMKVEKEYSSNSYEVKLSNGTEIEFDSKGKVIEIDAPDNKDLPESVVKRILPRKAYDDLKKNDVADNVESIEKKKGIYKVELNLPGDTEFFYEAEEIVSPE